MARPKGPEKITTQLRLLTSTHSKLSQMASLMEATLGESVDFLVANAYNPVGAGLALELASKRKLAQQHYDEAMADCEQRWAGSMQAMLLDALEESDFGSDVWNLRLLRKLFLERRVFCAIDISGSRKSCQELHHAYLSYLLSPTLPDKNMAADRAACTRSWHMSEEQFQYLLSRYDYSVDKLVAAYTCEQVFANVLKGERLTEADKFVAVLQDCDSMFGGMLTSCFHKQITAKSNW